MRSAIRKRLKDFIAILGLIALALAVAGVILHNERLRFPLIQSSTFNLKAEFVTAQAVTPGQGQAVDVAGVPIGQLSKVALQDGKAVVTMAIDPKYKGLVHTDAHALIRPRTGLQDVFVELNPGSRSAPVATPGWTIPIQNTLPEIDPDQVFAILDTDTRAYLKLLIHGAGQGLYGRGGNLRDVLARFEPTTRDIARVTRAVARRRRDLRQLINSLQRLNTSLAGRGAQLSSLVAASSQVFRALASENAGISRSIGLFPQALRTTRRTLQQVTPFANELGRAAEHLRPAARALTRANVAVRPAARILTPIIANQIRPFVVSARPLVRDLRPASVRLATATPSLTRTFVVLNHLFNLLAYNPKGRQAPNVNSAGLDQRQEGYLYWVAWVTHNTINFFNTADANGPFRPVELGGDCETFQALVNGQSSNVPPLAVLAPTLFGPQSPCALAGKLTIPPIPPIPALP